MHCWGAYCGQIDTHRHVQTDTICLIHQSVNYRKNKKTICVHFTKYLLHQPSPLSHSVISMSDFLCLLIDYFSLTQLKEKIEISKLTENT